MASTSGGYSDFTNDKQFTQAACSSILMCHLCFTCTLGPHHSQESLLQTAQSAISVTCQMQAVCDDQLFILGSLSKQGLRSIVVTLLYEFFPQYRCASYVGRLFFLRRPQGVSLGPGCVRISTVVHELGHVLGFYHEHNRPDRDDYINIRPNLSPGLSSQLERLSPSESNSLGLGYDHASIMHYSSLGGIITSKSGVPFGYAQELSPLDIEKTRRLYQCGKCLQQMTCSLSKTLLNQPYHPQKC